MADHPVASHVLAQAIEELGAKHSARPALYCDLTADDGEIVPAQWRLRWDAKGERWQAYGPTLTLLGESVTAWLRRQDGKQVAMPRVQRLPAKGGGRG